MPRESKAARALRTAEINRLLGEEYPGNAKELCALVHDSPFELVIATILSAQCTDERVNMVTPVLFARYPDAIALSEARPEDVEEIVKSTGFFRSKTKSIIGCATALAERHSDGFPTSMEDLTALPGVGRKTANVVRSVALGLPGLPVDTHVIRLSRRLGLTTSSDPVVIEAALCSMLEEDRWGALSLQLILHGRRVCGARAPRCDSCVIAQLCPSAGIGSLPVTKAKPRAKPKAKPKAGRRPATG